jgi:hypothetical protein
MSIDNLMAELDESVIAKRIATTHDEARIKYTLDKNTVDDFDEFVWYLADYYNYHFTECISNGGRFLQSDAYEKAKKILVKEYREHGGNIVSVFNNAHDGTNGGLRTIFDQIADALKSESIENYIQSAFDRYVKPNSWHQKVDIIRQFIDRCGIYLARSISSEEPERYAQNYQELIYSYLTALKKTSGIFRRL